MSFYPTVGLPKNYDDDIAREPAELPDEEEGFEEDEHYWDDADQEYEEENLPEPVITYPAE